MLCLALIFFENVNIAGVNNLTPISTMKKILNLLVLIFLYSKAYSQQNGGAWFKHYLEGRVSDVQFINDQVGFMTSNIYVSESNRTGFILKTTDGGHSWDTLPGELEYVSNISVISENIIWAGTVDKGVYKTTDGGSTWHNYNPSNANNFFVTDLVHLEVSNVHFSDENTGFVNYNDSRFLAKTTDGGANWSIVNRAYENIYQSQLSIVSKDLIFDFTHTLAGGEVLSKSIDGGNTWEEVTMPAEFESIDDFHRIKFLNEQDGFILDDERNYFYRTIDGGTTWTKYQVNNSGGWDDYLFVSKDIIYCFINSRLHKSIDGGTSWAAIGDELPLLVEYFFYTNEKIYLSGDKANLYVLENDNFEQLVGLHSGIHNIVSYRKPYFDGENYNSMHIQNHISDNDDLNYVYMSFDKDGRSSTYSKTDIVTDSYSDYSVNTMIASPSGAIKLAYPSPVRAIENNYNWEKLFDNTYQETRYSFDDVKFITENEALAVADGKIYKTENKGDSWIIISELDDDFDVNEMQFFGETEIRAIGDTFFYKTIDNGLNWTMIAIPDLSSNTGKLWSLYSFNENIIWAYGYTNVVIRSLDAGATWSVIEFNDISSVNNIHFKNENEGVVSYSDKVYMTNDGGNTWNLYTGDYIGINKCYSSFIDEDKGWLWSDNITYKFLDNPTNPTINSASYTQVQGNKYGVSLNWSSAEAATYYRIELLYIDFFDNEELLSVDITTKLNHTFKPVDLDKLPFLNSPDDLKVRVIACNYQNKSIKYSDNLTDVLGGTTLSINESIIEDSITSIYPNPVKSELHINTNNDIKESTIYSLSGKKIKYTLVTNTIDTSDLSNGLYIIEIQYNNDSASNFKFIKE